MTRSSPLADRFWAKVDKRGPDECWLWLGARQKTGHGLILRARGSKSTTTAHRVSWTIHVGPIPAGIYVLHDCDNPPCVNPAHLHLGTHADNMKEAGDRGLLAGRRGKPVLNIDPSEIRRRYAGGESQQGIADDLGISQTSVSRVIRRVEHWVS